MFHGQRIGMFTPAYLQITECE